MKRFSYLIIILCVSILTLAGCKRASHASGDKRVITVTIEPLRYFTEQIAGSHFKVVSMVPEGNSPETYDPTPQQLIDLAHSEAYLRIGYIGFEMSWMDKLKANVPQMRVFDTSEGVNLIQDMHEHDEHVHEGGVDPHIWNSTVNAHIIVRNICNALCQLDSANAAFYTHRMDSMNTVIDQTDREIRTILKTGSDKAFLIYHPALTYFAHDYGMKQVCIEEGGKEPSPAHLKELILQAKAEGIHTIFVQKEFDQRNAEAVATETGTKLISINPLSYQWKEEMIHIAQALKHEQ